MRRVSGSGPPSTRARRISSVHLLAHQSHLGGDLGARRPAMRSAESGQVSDLCFEDVRHDRFHLSSAATGAPPQLEACGGLRSGVERRPPRLEQPRQPFQLELADRPTIRRRRQRGHPEVGAGAARQALHDDERRAVKGSAETRGRPDGCLIAGSIGEQGGQGRGLVAAAPAPARPLEGAREDLLAARLEVDRQSGRRPVHELSLAEDLTTSASEPASSPGRAAAGTAAGRPGGWRTAGRPGAGRCRGRRS